MLGCMTQVGVAQSFNRLVPPGFFEYEFQQIDSADHGYFSFSLFKVGVFPTFPEYVPPTPVIFDQQGNLLWYRGDSPYGNSLDFKYHPDQHQFTLINVLDGETFSYDILDTNLSLVDSYTLTGGPGPDSHEFMIYPDGTRVLAGKENRIFDLSGSTFFGMPGSPTTNVRCFVIQEVDTANTLLWEWDSCDHIAPEQGYDFYGYSASNFDYCHGNAIEREEDGNYLVSFRNLNAIYKVNRATGNIMWQLGGKTSDFSFANDAGFSGQHDIRRLSNGDISLYDNGNMASPSPRSRTVTYHLDTTTFMATKTWEYTPDTTFFTATMGNAQIKDSLKMMSYGSAYRPYPSATLLDEDDNVISQFIFEDSVQSYRGFNFNMEHFPERPVLSCISVGGSLQLIAPPGFDAYLWSTGDTSDTITAVPGTPYQVWVSQGIGMMGSLPFHTPLEGGCMVTAMEEQIRQIPKLDFTSDILGRKVTQKESGKVYIEVYTDGSRRKVIQLD